MLKRPKTRNILIIGPAWIGDMIMAQALFKFLKAKDNDIMIDVLAPKWTLGLIERMPEIRSGLCLPFRHGELQLLKRYQFAKTLRKHNYDQVIVLPNSFKSALIALWAKIPLRTGWLGEWRLGVLNDVQRLNRQQFPLMVQQFLALGLRERTNLPKSLEEYYPRLHIDKQQQQKTMSKLGLNCAQPILALCPGAEYGPAKRWPIENFAIVANQMLNKGWQVWIFGSEKESSLAKQLDFATNQKCVDLTGKTTLSEAIDLIAIASAVISNDSGLMHIAAALDRPLVVIYGSSSPDFTPPLSQKVSMVNLALDCSPCFERTCPLGHFNCMKQISSDYVLSKLNSLISYDQNLNC